MKIRNINSLDRGLVSARSVESAQDGSERPLIFKRTLSEAGREQFMLRIGGLVAGIDEQGSRLAKRADIKEFEKYRSLIREFLGEVVSNGYEFTRERGHAPRGRQRFFATVNKVDAKLDELAREVLREHRDDLDILEKIGDIRGLLVDLLQ
ncbi:MAG: YaaR family protein [Oscillospiraceae bacterium]|nr:YaaR family protein [Oscillospiraceae bacterium]